MRFRKEWLVDVQNICALMGVDFSDKYSWHDHYQDGLTPKQAVLEYLDNCKE